ncbi:MAG: glutamate racemase [Candidatus Omnitrophica bacterium]|nr:glutamate racemase [Candidatus Omnitrophota bacterium]
MKNRAIGVFDSGVGGLTVLKEIEKLLPNENIIYFGDTARVPYGNKSKSTIVQFSTENILFLLKEKVKMVVVACNTSSSLALGYLKDIFKIPIIGVIEAGVNKALTVSLNRRVGVIGTKSTIDSKSYQNLIKSKDKKTVVFGKSCPLFVPLVEEGLLKGTLVNETISLYLSRFIKDKVDTVILGCTHYPLLKNPISDYLKNVNIIDSAKEVAIHTKGVLAENDLLNCKNIRGEKVFYVSDETKNFANLAKLFLKRSIKTIKL